MGAGLHQEPSVIHEASGVTREDYKNFNYNRVYASVEKDVKINGNVVTLTKGLVLPMAIRPGGVKDAGGGLDGIYLVGNKTQIATQIGSSPSSP